VGKKRQVVRGVVREKHNSLTENRSSVGSFHGYYLMYCIKKGDQFGEKIRIEPRVPKRGGGSVEKGA